MHGRAGESPLALTVFRHLTRSKPLPESHSWVDSRFELWDDSRASAAIPFPPTPFQRYSR